MTEQALHLKCLLYNTLLLGECHALMPTRMYYHQHHRSCSFHKQG